MVVMCGSGVLDKARQDGAVVSRAMGEDGVFNTNPAKRLLLVTQRRLAATFMFVKTQKSGRCWGKAHTRTPPSVAIGHRPTLTALGPGDFVEVGPGPFLGRVQWGRQGPAPVDPLQVLRCGLSTATFNSTASRFITHQYRQRSSCCFVETTPDRNWRS